MRKLVAVLGLSTLLLAGAGCDEYGYGYGGYGGFGGPSYVVYDRPYYTDYWVEEVYYEEVYYDPWWYWPW